MRTKANKARNEVRRRYPSLPENDPAFDQMVAERMRAQNEGAYDPDSFANWFKQFGGFSHKYDDNTMERETIEQVRPQMQARIKETPGERRRGKRKHRAGGL